MRRTPALILLLAVILLGGCSDDGGGDSVDADASAGADAEGGSGEFSGDDSGDFCTRVKVLADDEALQMDGSDSKEATSEKAGRALEALEGLEDVAPEEIEEDVATVVDALRPTFEVMASGRDFSELSEEEQAELGAFDEKKVQAATARLNSYVEKVCEIDIDEDGDTDGVDASTEAEAETETGTSDDSTDETTSE